MQRVHAERFAQQHMGLAAHLQHTSVLCCVASPRSAKLHNTTSPCGEQIHESKEAGVYVAGLQEDIVTSPEHVLQLLEEGERGRHVGETRMNKNSSRSHTMFRMVRGYC